MIEGACQTIAPPSRDGGTHATLGPCLTAQESAPATRTSSQSSLLTLQPGRATISLAHLNSRQKTLRRWRWADWAASREGRRGPRRWHPKSGFVLLGKPRRRVGKKMTAEVAVLNKFGLALAADSAVTVDHWHERKKHTKVYNTANKLFTLSKFEPVPATASRWMRSMALRPRKRRKLGLRATALSIVRAVAPSFRR